MGTRLGALIAGLRAPAADRLPARVRETITAQQAASEVLIGWVQLVIVSTFAALYAVSPKTFAKDANFEPVPWVLGAYFAFTLLRLFLAYRGRLPGWLLMLSVVLDMALLLITIWSFHLQYRQPASFYLKSPTLLYVFIFIALRALRFEARYVVLAGAVAAGGWLAMMIYAIVIDPENDMVTRDYVLYMTSNHVLLGAEFDKIMSILMVTAVLAVAILRARRLLVRAVTEQAAARDLSRFFAPEIAERITRSENKITAGQGETRNAAILFVDVRGFTRLATEIPADDLIGLLSEYQSRMVPLIRAHGGAVDKFMGDGIMATFGAAVPSATYAADALNCVGAVMRAADDWNDERRQQGLPAMAVGAAVATGPVVFGAVGFADRLEYTVIGDAVNLAAKLEKHNKSLKVRALTTETALAAAVAQGYEPSPALEHRPAGIIGDLDTPLDLVVLAA